MAYKGAKKTATNYSIELSETNDILDITVIHSKDDEYMYDPDKKPLYERLGSIEGVYDVDYNGHFGNQIYLTMGANYDEYSTWKELKKCINDFLEGE